MDTSPLPLTAILHDNTIESLQQELLGKINEQAEDIHLLKLSNDELKSKVNGHTSSNAELADDTQPGNPNKTPKMASFGITQVRGRLRGG
jgi:hypothetical protein